MKFEIPKNEQSIIKVIGVGGGGGNAVNYMYKQGIVGVDFILCNTDAQVLETSPVPNKIQLGPSLTEGRGAGSKPEVGKQACLESNEDIQQYLSNNTKMLFITAGMGGGTGTGAAPVIAKIAQEMDILTVGIVTIPFGFEGGKRKKFATEGLQELRDNVDTLVVISNDKLMEIYPDLGLNEAFAKADNILTTAAKGIAEIITIPGYVNVDFEDVNTVMRNSGKAVMGTGKAEGDDRALSAIDAALNSPLLEENNIAGATNILMQISYGRKEATMMEIKQITDFINQEVGNDTNVIWGNCYDPNMRDELAITIIATGFEYVGGHGAKKEPARHLVNLEDATSLESALSVGNKQQNVVEFDAGPSDYYTSNEMVSRNEMELEMRQKRMEEERMRKAALLKQNNPTKLNSSQTLSEMENMPAYKRRRILLDEISLDDEMSDWGVTSDRKLDTQSNNSYIHKEVD